MLLHTQGNYCWCKSEQEACGQERWVHIEMDQRDFVLRVTVSLHAQEEQYVEVMAEVEVADDDDLVNIVPQAHDNVEKLVPDAMDVIVQE